MTLAAAGGMGTASSPKDRWHGLGSVAGRASGEIKFAGVTAAAMCPTGAMCI